MHKNYDDIEEQAQLCEEANRFAMAAILWRRIGRTDEANACERIIQALAENEQFILKLHAVTVKKRVFQ